MSNFLVFLSYFSLLLLFGSSISNNITNTQYLKDPQVLVSSNSIFKFGFFSPGNSSNRYVGIWYDTNNDSDILEVIWVANRDNPLKDSSGVLNISKDGHLQLLNGENHTFWSSNSTTTHEVDIESDLFLPSIFAQLQDSGNLVLLSNASGGSIFWQSFHHPTNSLLPRMEVAFNKTTNNSKQLKSWKTTTDPSTGRFRAGVDPRMLPEVFIWDGDRPYWRSGPWNGHVFIGVPSMYYFVLVDGFSLEDNQEGVINLSFTTSDKSVTRHYVLSYDGVITQKDWDNVTMNWTIIWQSLQSKCDIYGKCGEFGRCRSNDSEICGCLKGFEPRNRKEWRKGNWSSGCVRKTPLQCGGTNGEEEEEEEEEDGFWKLRNIKVPDYAKWLRSDDEGHCRRQCLRNCSCIAYAYHSGIGCMIWTSSLVDIQDFSSLGVDLFVRLAHSDLEFGSKWRLILAVTIGVGGATLVLVTFCIWRRTKRKNSDKNAIYNGKQIEAIKLEKLQDLQLFQLDKLAAATNNFDDRNKLGQGGFGPVFKGKFEDGQEIAVKRLSKASGQGLQEFMNEVDVIAKLQHRNLVKLLGCCVDGEEKMLVYEYMPNKSLDAFLFDPKNQEFLDWKKRYKIIEGICRGILYLHRDSRLKIIHRDLKPSNILLDDDLSAKISDFGMARIFGVKEDQGSTRRVVGTYGYMSPEYAMEGRFSEKSDVFSFGVLLLEIICGRKNSSFIDDESWSLIGHAWKLRNEDNLISLIDPRMNDPSFYEEILKCIEVGLLCVQEVPEERPSIYTIISMLDSVITDLPKPTQPVFTQTKYYYPKRFPQICGQESVNNLTYTSHFSGR